MVAAFGTPGDNPRWARFRPDRIVENRSRLDAFALSRHGALVHGAITMLKWKDGGCRFTADWSALMVEVGGAKHRVEITTDAPMPHVQYRPWFVCPVCSRRCRYLYVPELACQRCLRLDWQSRHQFQKLSALPRITRLRRLIAADPQPFTPLPPRPRRGGARYDRFVAKLVIEEQKLVDHLAGINHDLGRRIRSRKAKGGQWWRKAKAKDEGD